MRIKLANLTMLYYDWCIYESPHGKGNLNRHPGPKILEKMSAKEDIESNEEIKEISVLTLKNVLIVLGSLTVVAALSFGVLYVTSGSRVQSQSQAQTETENESESDSVKLMVFHSKDKVYKLNPLKSELKAEPVFKRSSKVMAGKYLKLSDDKTKIYSWGNKALHVYDALSYWNWLSDVDVKLPGYCPCPLFVNADNNVGLISNKPGPTSVVYPAKLQDSGEYLIRHYNLDRKEIIGDYEPECGNKRFLRILDQSNDGSKIFYQCGDEYVWKKNLDDPEEQDQRIFITSFNNKMFILLGESKAIVYGDHLTFWKIVDLENPQVKEKLIYFNTTVHSVASMLLSDDQTVLYVLLNISEAFNVETKIKLFEINVNHLLNHNSSDIFQIESDGREVELSSIKK